MLGGSAAAGVSNQVRPDHYSEPLVLSQKSGLIWGKVHAVAEMCTKIKELWQQTNFIALNMEAFENIQTGLMADNSVTRHESQSVLWLDAECKDWFESLDKIFFNGALRDRVTVTGSSTYTWEEYAKQSSAVGHAQPKWNNETKFVDVDIKFETFEYDAEFLTKIQKRTRALQILCHEMLHAIFICYGCRCAECWQFIGEDGHGPGWKNVAEMMGQKLHDLFKDQLSFPASRDDLRENPFNIVTSVDDRNSALQEEGGYACRLQRGQYPTPKIELVLGYVRPRNTYDLGVQ